MTQEEKARAYEEAVKVIKDNLDALNEITETGAEIVNIQAMKNCFYRAFPELKEFEGERIKKEIIEYFDKQIKIQSLYEVCEDSDKNVAISKKKNNKFQTWIAWLEKQGEQNKMEKCVNCQFIYTGYCNGTCILEKEKKIEPKFKVGDWIVLENVGIFQVIEICGSWYEVIDIEGFHYSISFCREYMCHLWTIKDAKDGDILMANAPFIFNGNLEGGIGCPGAHCAINTLGKFQIPKSPRHWTGHTTTPATKEQRDLLFQKMHEAGYTFDFETKELKKIHFM